MERYPTNLSVQNRMIEMLFETEAFKVCKEGQLFWYTSGTLGPYYINTHYLFGGKDKATEFLEYIETNLKNKDDLNHNLLDRILKNYNQDKIFSQVIDILLDNIKRNEDLSKIDYISGGERRDWFFSLVVAYFLKKPHITIFKDMSTIVWNTETSSNLDIVDVEMLKGKNVLHIADLVTEASSYERVWIPAINNLKAQIKSTYVIVDRMQNGKDLLNSKGVNLTALLNIDNNLFINAKKLDFINDNQLKILVGYFQNPFSSVRQFLIENPNFIKDALKGEIRIKERAELCIKDNIYKQNS